MPTNETFDGPDPFDWRAVEVERHSQQTMAGEDIQRRCRSVAERLEALAGSRHDLIASANPDQPLLLEAASLLRGYHQCLLVDDVLNKALTAERDAAIAMKFQYEVSTAEAWAQLREYKAAHP